MVSQQDMTKEELEFWWDVERRRNVFYYVWAGWLLAGFPLVWIYEYLIKSDDPMTAMSAALYTWGAIWLWTAFRLTSMKCLKCGKKAFSHPFFFMKHAKCKKCGFAKAGS